MSEFVLISVSLLGRIEGFANYHLSSHCCSTQ